MKLPTTAARLPFAGTSLSDGLRYTIAPPRFGAPPMPRPLWPSENAALWLHRFRTAFIHARVPLTAAGLTFMT